jgi:hypothetical protein
MSKSAVFIDLGQEIKILANRNVDREQFFRKFKKTSAQRG